MSYAESNCSAGYTEPSQAKETDSDRQTMVVTEAAL